LFLISVTMGTSLSWTVSSFRNCITTRPRNILDAMEVVQ